MSVTGKSSKALLKKDLINQKLPATSIKQLVFAHKAAAGETGINLSALIVPPEYSVLGFLQAGTDELLRANLLFNRKNLKLISSARGVLLDYDSYVVSSNNQITFTGSFGTSLADEIFVGYVEPVVRTGTLVADVEFILSTGTLAAGNTDISVGKSFQTNLYPTEQLGAVAVHIDCQQFLRNVGNATAAPGADGDYEEVDNGAGRSTVLRLNASDGSDRSYIVVSTATTVVRPDGSVMDEVERQAGVLDSVIATTAVLAGVPESDFQSVPSQPQLKQFGDRLVAVENATSSPPARMKGHNFKIGISVGVPEFILYNAVTYDDSAALVQDGPTGPVFATDGTGFVAQQNGKYHITACCVVRATWVIGNFFPFMQIAINGVVYSSAPPSQALSSPGGAYEKVIYMHDDVSLAAGQKLKVAVTALAATDLGGGVAHIFQNEDECYFAVHQVG